MGPRSSQIQILGPKICYANINSWILYNFCFVKFLPSFMLEAVKPPDLILGPPDPRFRVRSKARRLRPDQVNYWEGALQLLFNKLCLKIIDHGSRSTWGPGPSRSGRVKVRSRRSRPDQVDYWEGPLQLLFNKLCLKMIDHGSRSTWGPGPSRSG